MFNCIDFHISDNKVKHATSAVLLGKRFVRFRGIQKFDL